MRWILIFLTLNMGLFIIISDLTSIAKILYTVILLLRGQFCTLANILGYYWPRCLDSRPGSPRGQYTSRQSGPGCRLQSDSTSDVLCADRGEATQGTRGMGREIGILETEASNKTGHTAACYTGGPSANVQSVACWQIPKQPPWILNIVCP